MLKTKWHSIFTLNVSHPYWLTRSRKTFIIHFYYIQERSTLPGLEPGIPWFVVRCLNHWGTGLSNYFQTCSYLFINTCAPKENDFTKVREKQPWQNFVKHFKRVNLWGTVYSLCLTNTNCYMAHANNNNGRLKFLETATGMKILVKKLV